LNEKTLEFAYYNYMGNRVPFCGNAIRALPWFARKAGLIETDEPVVMASGREYRVFLREHEAGVELEFKLLGPQKGVERLNIGVEHGVVFTEGLETRDIKALKARLGNPEMNLNFAQEIPKGLMVRSLEQGYPEEPLSCATGAASAGVLYCLKKGLSRVDITTKGGPLRVELLSHHKISLWGPIRLIYTGWLDGVMELQYP